MELVIPSLVSRGMKIILHRTFPEDSKIHSLALLPEYHKLMPHEVKKRIHEGNERPVLKALKCFIGTPRRVQSTSNMRLLLLIFETGIFIQYNYSRFDL